MTPAGSVTRQPASVTLTTHLPLASRAAAAGPACPPTGASCASSCRFLKESRWRRRSGHASSRANASRTTSCTSSGGESPRACSTRSPTPTLASRHRFVTSLAPPLFPPRASPARGAARARALSSNRAASAAPRSTSPLPRREAPPDPPDAPPSCRVGSGPRVKVSSWAPQRVSRTRSSSASSPAVSQASTLTPPRASKSAVDASSHSAASRASAPIAASSAVSTFRLGAPAEASFVASSSSSLAPSFSASASAAACSASREASRARSCAASAFISASSLRRFSARASRASASLLIVSTFSSGAASSSTLAASARLSSSTLAATDALAPRTSSAVTSALRRISSSAFCRSATRSIAALASSSMDAGISGALKGGLASCSKVTSRMNCHIYLSRTSVSF
mmetsp:Transcript_45226/g.102119  ORF Transcript_45226/g.102119 Transcript_45226/m.102119 type:complete len:398 (+) Transcript_45226:269-1462(+)